MFLPVFLCHFYNYHTGNKGDDFYAMMQPTFKEPILNKLGYTKKYKGMCPITEEVQSRSMLFKTNYRSASEAKRNIDNLNNSLAKY